MGKGLYMQEILYLLGALWKKFFERGEDLFNGSRPKVVLH